MRERERERERGRGRERESGRENPGHLINPSENYSRIIVQLTFSFSRARQRNPPPRFLLCFSFFPLATFGSFLLSLLLFSNEHPGFLLFVLLSFPLPLFCCSAFDQDKPGPPWFSTIKVVAVEDVSPLSPMTSFIMVAEVKGRVPR